MKIFVLLSLATIALARPEPPSPYQYNAPKATPSLNYGTPSDQSYDIPRNSYAAPSSGNLNTNYGPPAAYGAPVQAPTIHKHVYVHVAPNDEAPAPQRPISVPAPQKHYKIIFIKAPSAPAYQAPIIPLIPQNEEKTLVYVLVKKPEQQPDIIIPTAAPTEPSKPEVYFIKYKTQKQEGYPESIAPAPAGDYGAPISQQSAPAGDYGAPIAQQSAPSSEYGAPQ